MNTERKCMTITKQNVEYIKSLVRQKKAKNFSRAVNETIEQRRMREQNNNNNN